MIDPNERISVELTQQQTWIVEQLMLIERDRAREEGNREVAKLCTEIHTAMINAKIRAANMRRDSGGDA